MLVILFPITIQLPGIQILASIFLFLRYSLNNYKGDIAAMLALESLNGKTNEHGSS